VAAKKKIPAKKTRLKRARNPMPAAIRAALVERGLLAAYKARPDFQQNDYLGWIARGKLEATRARRLAQMLDELERGGVYMKMKWSGPALR
jgi:uncharacterized protein YdeI (YjbR/CyaY-like superfamily)